MATGNSDIFMVDFTDLKDLRRRLGQFAGAAESVAAQAINRSMRDEKARITKTIRKYLAIKAGSMNRRIKKYDATRNDPRGIIVMKEKHPPNVESFTRPSRTRRGVTAILRPGAGRVLFEHAFFATPQKYGAQARKTHKRGLVWERAVIGGKRVGRMPIDLVRGPSPVKLVQDDRKVYAEITDELGANIEKEIDRSLNLFFLKKKGLA